MVKKGKISQMWTHKCPSQILWTFCWVSPASPWVKTLHNVLMSPRENTADYLEDSLWASGHVDDLLSYQDWKRCHTHRRPQQDLGAFADCADAGIDVLQTNTPDLCSRIYMFLASCMILRWNMEEIWDYQQLNRCDNVCGKWIPQTPEEHIRISLLVPSSCS